MKKLNLSTFLFLVFFLALGCKVSVAQTVAGKVFLKEEADKLFGPVLQSVTMTSAQFQSILKQSGNFLKLRFDGPDLSILSNERRVLFQTGSLRTFAATEQLKVYSASVIKELLSKGQSATITIERRENVMSVTNGNYTMEEAACCPPDCPWEK